MAPTLAAASSSNFQDRPQAVRSDTTRSSASSDGASLRRSSRTRTKTLTAPGRRDKSAGAADARMRAREEEESPYGGIAPASPMATTFSTEPQELEVPTRMRKSTLISQPPRKPKSSGTGSEQGSRPGTAMSFLGMDSKGASSSRFQTPRGRSNKSEAGSGKSVKARLRGMSLPRQAFKTPLSSDSSTSPSPRTPAEVGPSVPAVHVVGDSGKRFRDSVISHNSATSSSIYPASTISGSRSESSFFPSTVHSDMSEFNPEIVLPENEFDPDDVSYRLRLLVNNSYFLPPAHAKPSPTSLTPADVTKKAQAESAKPTFLDFFRIGKSKSRPPTPSATTPPAPPPGPILRTTADDSTASGYLRRPHSKSLPQTPTIPLLPPSPSPSAMNHVVVLRESLDDLVRAARQAEREIQNRTEGRSQTTPRANDLVDNVVDPTDAVDLPTPLDGYLFAVPGSTQLAIGVGESLGADILAEELPPAMTPGVWSVSSQEDSWRKELLHQAVTHSLKSVPSVPFLSSADQSLASPSSPEASSSACDVRSPSADSFFDMSSDSGHEQVIGRPILQDYPEVPKDAEAPTQQSLNSSLSATASIVSPRAETVDLPKRESWRQPEFPPERMESPARHTPLAPPPLRKPLVNPLYSLSQPDLSEPSLPNSAGTSASHMVRKAMSAPRLSATHDRRAGLPTQRETLTFTPPPTLLSGAERSSSALETLREFHSSASQISETDDELSYRTPMDTEAERDAPRPSISVSLFSDGERPSMSEYSVPSPTGSAFHDGVFGSCRSPSPLARRSYMAGSHVSGPSMRDSSPAARDPRAAAVVSPPPRTSSSLSPAALPPPPRSSVIRSVHSLSTDSRPSLTVTPPAPSRQPSSLKSMDSVESFVTPAPSIPLTGRRGRSSLSLRIPTEEVPESIHSAPAPASPTAFFDHIQAQHNAMDDLDTSDESSTEEDVPPPPPPPPNRYAEPQPLSSPSSGSARASSASSRPSFMRLGNHSTPHLRPSQDAVSFDMDRKKPISNIAEPPLPRNSIGFLSSMKKKGVEGTSRFPPPVSSSGPSSHKRRPATANSAGASSKSSKRWQRESVQKFDGMLAQFSQLERERVKRITSSAVSVVSVSGSPATDSEQD